MGAINYGNSEYVNLGLDLSLNENGMDTQEEWENYANEIREATQDVLGTYDFAWFNVEIKSGYYDGFYLKISDNLPAYFYNQKIKDDAKVEALSVKNFLLECAEDCGLRSYITGWSTAYLDKGNTVHGIDLAYHQMLHYIEESGVEDG